MATTYLDYPDTLPARIRWHREYFGWRVSDVPGFSHTTIWNYERGQRPTPKRLRELAHVFGLPVEVLDDQQTAPPVPRAPEATRSARRALQAGRYHEAYMLAKQANSIALAEGNTERVAELENIIREALQHMPPGEFVELALASAPLPLGEEIMNMIYFAPVVNWRQLLDINATLLQRIDKDQAHSRKWMRNRARIWYEVGEFALEVACFNAAPYDDSIGHAVVLGQQLSVAEALVYQGQPLPDLSAAAQFLTMSRLIWELYWSVQYRNAWDHQRYQDLQSIWVKAHASADHEATPSPELVLAGLKAMVDYTRRSDEGLHQLELTLERLTGTPRSQADTRLAQELTMDYLRVMVKHPTAHAFGVWAHHVALFDAQGRSGWVRYWLQHRPDYEAWESLAATLRGRLRQLMHNPPRPLVDNTLSLSKGL